MEPLRDPGVQLTARAAGRADRWSPAAGRLARFAAIGLACTAAFAILYPLLRQGLAPVPANVAALAATMGVNFLANRRYTFAAHGRPLAPQLAQYAVAYLAGMAVSSAALTLALDVTSGRRPTWRR